MTRTIRALTLPVTIFGVLAAGPAGADDKSFKADLEGFQEVPAISTGAGGEFRARLSNDETMMEYTLSYSGLEGEVRQAHIHLGQHSVNGGVSVFLCQTTFNPDPTGNAPACLQEGTVSGTIRAANIIGPAGQGIAATEFAELIAALRGGVAYANVHSTKFPGGEIRGQIK